MSYAADQSQALSAALATITPTIVAGSESSSAGPPSPSEASNAQSEGYTTVQAQESRLKEAHDRTSHLRSVLTRLHPGHSTSSDTIAGLLDEAFPRRDSAQDSRQITTEQSQSSTADVVTLAQLAISSYGAVLDQLLAEAARLGDEDDWWAQVENDRWRTGFYLLQTTPSRTISLALTTLTRLRQMTAAAMHSSSAPPSMLSLATYKTALPPSLLLTAVFPHLNASPDDAKDKDDLSTLNTADEAADSGPLLTATRLARRKTRSLFFLTMSPLALTRQEIAHTRAEIRAARQDLATRIGNLTLASTRAESTGEDEQDGQDKTLAVLLSSAPAEPPSVEDIKAATWTTIANLSQAVASSGESALRSRAGSMPLPSLSTMAQELSLVLRQTLPAHQRQVAEAFEPLLRPPFLTRAWPYLLSIPLGSLVLGRTIYNNRDTIARWFLQAGETVKSFLIDWVVEPVKDILETVRGGQGTGMSLMSRESLKSDLKSLERMVVEFGRDEYKLGEPQLSELAQKVRDGDLTTVLRAWEHDIKSPIRSAIGGNLIRALLIQVQKVKVDVALAMDGIEKMLRSQQLTFGFVGVAPSLLVLYAFGSWARGLMRTDGGKKKAREQKRKCWMTMRELDLLLSPPRKTPSSASAATTQGLLLLSLSSLRTYANSGHFPRQDTQLRTAFLDDVRALEDEGARAHGEARRVLLARLWRWSDTLHWTV